MKLLVSTRFAETRRTIQKNLANTTYEICFVGHIDDLITEIKSGGYHAIVSDYCIDGANIWQITKLVNSSQYADFCLPVLLIADGCEIDIPPILARECHFSLVFMNDLLKQLTKIEQVYQATGAEPGHLKPAKSKLLIIDDDEDAAFIAYHALKDQFDPEIAHNGLSGYSRWQKGRHNLILLDIMLPGMMGDIVLEKIMEIDRNQPVIIITGHDQVNNHRDFLLNGASEYVCKPFAMSDLKDLCQTILNRAKLIYQADYLKNKLDRLGSLLWMLDQSLANHNLEKSNQIMATIKKTLPACLSDDQKIRLLNGG